MATFLHLFSALIAMAIQRSDLVCGSPLQRQAVQPEEGEKSVVGLHRLTPSYDQYIPPVASQSGLVIDRLPAPSERNRIVDRVVDNIVVRAPPPETVLVRPTSAGVSTLAEGEAETHGEGDTGAAARKPPALGEEANVDIVPCQARNKTVVIEKRGCDTVRVELKVCSGMCATQVSSQKRFPYISPVCRSCQPDQDSIEFVKVYQPCRAGKRVRTFELQLPSARVCKCHRCFSDWALSFPAVKKRLPLSSS